MTATESGVGRGAGGGREGAGAGWVRRRVTWAFVAGCGGSRGVLGLPRCGGGRAKGWRAWAVSRRAMRGGSGLDGDWLAEGRSGAEERQVGLSRSSDARRGAVRRSAGVRVCESAVRTPLGTLTTHPRPTGEPQLVDVPVSAAPVNVRETRPPRVSRCPARVRRGVRLGPAGRRGAGGRPPARGRSRRLGVSGPGGGVGRS